MNNSNSLNDNEISKWLENKNIQYKCSDNNWSYKTDANGIILLMSIFSLKSGFVQLADFQFEIQKPDQIELLPLINAINTKIPYGTIELNNEILMWKFYHFWHSPEQVSKSLEISQQNLSFFISTFYSIIRACVGKIITTDEAIAKLE